uniref:Major facilitator superfamily domain containing 8 n=1 Tax=Gasterosteus aculeatus aculeatus TaxID=481459 RepID=A0AAQ4NZV0_GASAC
MSQLSDSDDTTPLLGDDSSSDASQDEDYRSRWRSIRVMYFTMFLSSVGFTIVITSLWPYLQKVDDSASATFLGWAVAAYSLGQMAASPIFGTWSNYRPHKEPLVCSIILNLLANVYYAYAYLPRTNNKFHVLISRALVGFGAESDRTIDHIAVLTSNALFFIVMFIFAVFETIITPLSMDMYAWTRTEAVLYNGIIICCIGLQSILVFIIVKVVSVRYGDRPVMLAGLVIILCGFFILLPWGNHYPKIQWADLKNSSLVGEMNKASNHSAEPTGCPYEQTWCQYTPSIHLAQFISSNILIGVGYPACNVMSYTLYSKILGPIPQGVYMGWLTASGSGARTVAPVFVSQVYTILGPRWCFSLICGMVVGAIVLLSCCYHRLVAFSVRHRRSV